MVEIDSLMRSRKIRGDQQIACDSWDLKLGGLGLESNRSPYYSLFRLGTTQDNLALALVAMRLSGAAGHEQVSFFASLHNYRDADMIDPTGKVLGRSRRRGRRGYAIRFTGHDPLWNDRWRTVLAHVYLGRSRQRQGIGNAPSPAALPVADGRAATFDFDDDRRVATDKNGGGLRP